MIILNKKYSKEEQVIIINDMDDDLKPIEFALPDIPNDNNILFHNLPQHQQKWYAPGVRPVYPERLTGLIIRTSKYVEEENIRRKNIKKLIFNDEIHKELFRNRDKYDDIHRWILQEWHRRLNGLWFFNNGVRTYITGKMYYWLNYWTIPEGKPDYRDKDRRYFHFLTEAILNTECFGIIEMTRRKEGKSMRASCAEYEEGSRALNRHCGIQSKNDDDASDFFNKLVLGWKNMAFYFQPIHSHLSTDPKAVLRFSSESGDAQGEAGIGSWIDFRPAKALAYDSTYLKFYVSDEEGKLETVDAEERWGKVKPALQAYDGKITGKSIHTTTVEDVGMYGFKKFKNLWVGSDYHERNELGQTQTGLWRIFSPAYDGLVIDEFGMSKYRESKKILDVERNSLRGGSKGYYELVRKKPYTTKECFTINAGACPFDKDILTQRLMYFFKGNDYVRRGDFVWEGGIRDGKVEFVDNPNGRFYVTFLPNAQQRNKWDVRGRVKVPGNNLFFVAGGDTFNFDETEGEGSNGGGAVYMKHNPVMEKMLSEMPEGMDEKQINDFVFKYKTERFVCTYNNRPPTKEEYVEDMIKMCVYFGCYMFPELNHTHIQDGFNRRGYGGYLLHQYDEKKQKIKINSGDVTNDRTKDNLFMVSQEYVVKSAGWEFHDELLEQFLGVTYETMTKYDLFSAAAYALYANSLTKHLIEAERNRMEKKEKQQDNKQRKWFFENQIL